MNLTIRPLPLFIAIVAALYVGACGSAVKHPVPLSRATGEAHYPLPEYRIQPGDRLDIKFFYNDQLNEEVTVRPDGRISLQLAHEIMAANSTPAALTDTLTERYALELSEPKITVIVQSFNSQNAFVGGEVNKPELVALHGVTTTLQAIFQAGGFKNTARTNQVVLIRRAPDHTPLVMQLDLNKAIDGTDLRQDMALMAYDIVFVPKSPIANVNQFVAHYIRNILPITPGVGFSYRLE